MPNGVIDTNWNWTRRIPFEKRTREEHVVLTRLSRHKADRVRNKPNGVNEDEEIARIWLEMTGHFDIRLGDDPPDYVVEDRYAVEVRRLNRMVEADGRNEGEEVSLYPLSAIVNDVLQKLGPPHPGEHCWYVDINYEIDVGQPPKKWQKKKKEQIKTKLREVLRLFDGREGVTIQVGCGISLVFWRAYEPLSQRYLLNQVDDPGAGWVLANLIPSIKSCIEEKTGKIKYKLKELSELEGWWLILVDHISHGMIASNKHYLKSVREQIPSHGPWSRCIVVDYWKPDMYFEL